MILERGPCIMHRTRERAASVVGNHPIPVQRRTAMFVSWKTGAAGIAGALLCLFAVLHRSARPLPPATTSSPLTPVAARAGAQSPLTHLPLLFEPNQGQAARQFDFVARSEE